MRTPPGKPPEELDTADTVADGGDAGEDGDDQPATQVASPAARRRVSRSIATEVVTPDGATRHSTTTDPLAAMRLEELARTKIFLWIILAILAAVLAALPFLDGHPTATRIMGGGMAITFATVVLMMWQFSDPARFTASRLLFGGVFVAVGAFTGVYYFGVFSPGPAILVLGIYYISLGYSGVAAAILYGLVAALQLGTALAIIAGVAPDYGLIRADSLGTVDRLLAQMLVQLLLLCAFVMGRLSRRRTLEAVGQLERAIRQVAQREALLREARQDLDRALKVGGPGRYTEQTIGSFRLGMIIGRGGMGEVYEATHLEEGTPAALKLLNQQSLQSRDVVTRFLRETEAAASLDVPHVVRVLEFGTEGDIPYLAMERLEGRDLAYHLRKRRRLAPRDVVTLVEQIGAGLAAAREAGIVHRDIKPQNLFFSERRGADPVWKILDFGVSKLADHGGTLTRGKVVGTPNYMAPEQARGDAVDHRADLYSLAVIAYRALTGHLAFTGKDVHGTLYAVVYEMPARPSLLGSLPEDIDLALAVGMAKRPADRFDSGAELARAIRLATTGALDEATRERARRLIERLPWRAGAARGR